MSTTTSTLYQIQSSLIGPAFTHLRYRPVKVVCYVFTLFFLFMDISEKPSVMPGTYVYIKYLSNR